MKNESDTRAYRQTVRAKAAEKTGERIVAAFRELFEKGWFEEVRLEDVAALAGVSVQTVVRRFGGKDGLLEACSAQVEREVREDRQLPVGDPGRAVSLLVAEYETRGDLVMRLLAQEDRHPSIKTVTDLGRKSHRGWTAEVFAPWLGRLNAEDRAVALDRLVIALDVYLWKLVRVDMRRSTQDLAETMLAFCAAALGRTPEELLAPSPNLVETTHA